MTLQEFRELTGLMPGSTELAIAYGDECFPVKLLQARGGNTLVLSQGGYDRMADAKTMFMAIAKLSKKDGFKQQCIGTPIKK